jgi:hypothetical protein
LDPSALSTGLQLVPDASAAYARFAIAHVTSRTIENLGTFDAFVTALSADLTGTVAVMQVAADGPYDATTGVFSADQIIVLIND